MNASKFLLYFMVNYQTSKEPFDGLALSLENSDVGKLHMLKLLNTAEVRTHKLRSAQKA